MQKSGKGPIIIMGHSLGADAAIYMAEKMKTSRGFGCSDSHVRPDDEFSGTVKRGTSYQLLYG